MYLEIIMTENDSIKRQFLGYKETHFLWENDLFGLKQFVINSENCDFNMIVNKRLRLGHLVEHFVQFEFENQKEIHVLGKNIQVVVDKQTLGEFDFFIEKEAIHYQVEVVYKFYLYDETVGASEIEHWIGPNRNDSLDQKIEKIKTKQFPLINRPEARSVLEAFEVNTKAVQQRVLFKGKLFVPYGKRVEINSLNPVCISGFYIRFDELSGFKNYMIYIPVKHDWIISPHVDVAWMNFEEALLEILKMMDENRSPLVWFKDEDGFLTQGFVVWWERGGI